jgi:hypothetical protein
MHEFEHEYHKFILLAEEASFPRSDLENPRSDLENPRSDLEKIKN